MRLGFREPWGTLGWAQQGYSAVGRGKDILRLGIAGRETLGLGNSSAEQLSIIFWCWAMQTLGHYRASPSLGSLGTQGYSVVDTAKDSAVQQGKGYSTAGHSRDNYSAVG